MSRCRHNGDIAIAVYLSAAREHDREDGVWSHNLDERGSNGYITVTCKVCGQQSHATPRGRNLTAWALKALEEAEKG